MSALGMASLGTQCAAPALGMATLGVICGAAVEEPTTDTRRGGRRGSTRYRLRAPDLDRTHVTREQLLREDEELIALVAAAIAEGIIP